MQTLTRKEKRAYNRLLTGLSIGNHQNAYMRFITLTTAPGCTQDINKSFDVLKKRIARATHKDDGFHGFKFNRYFKLKTAEGNGVLHIIYWGLYIPHEWLKRNWDEIHGAFKVDIRSCWDQKSQRTRMNGIVGYLLTNYLTKQPIIRMSYGWKWAWLGFCRSWVNVKKAQGHIRANMKNKPLREVTYHTPDYSKWITERKKVVWEEKRTFSYFKDRYRNCLMDYWNSLMKCPLPTSRQLKFCNPDHTRYNGKVVHDWIEAPERKWQYYQTYDNWKESLDYESSLKRPAQAEFAINPANNKLLLTWKHPKPNNQP